MPSLITYDTLRDIAFIYEDLWGIFLFDYIVSIELFSNRAIWKDPSDVPIINAQCAYFTKVMTNINIFISKKPDKLFWASSKIGDYTIKEGHLAIK